MTKSSKTSATIAAQPTSTEAETPPPPKEKEIVGSLFEAHTDMKHTPRIAVFGVGGAGGNAVNNMIRSDLRGVEFFVCNTDAQALKQSMAATKIQLGPQITQGLGAGSKPEIGRAAAEEILKDFDTYFNGINMVFVTAGMGGGTGTGAAPFIAQAARDRGLLTVGVVTKPFHFEGSHRMKTAEQGIELMQKHVDTLIVIPNQNLFRVANERTTFADAFRMADEVLHAGVRGITDLMIMPGLINLDFADVRTVMSEMGKAMMGTGEAQGDNRAILAAEAAISNPLLDDISMRGARGVLISITGGEDLTLYEVDEAANRIREEVDAEANIIFGSTFNPELSGKMRVSVVATGIDAQAMAFLRGQHATTAPAVAEVSAGQSLKDFAGNQENHTFAFDQATDFPTGGDQDAAAHPHAKEDLARTHFSHQEEDLFDEGDELYIQEDHYQEENTSHRFNPPPVKRSLLERLGFGGGHREPKLSPEQEALKRAPSHKKTLHKQHGPKNTVEEEMKAKISVIQEDSHEDHSTFDVPAYLRKANK